MQSRNNWFFTILFSALLLLISGLFYDYMMGESACIICWLQRFVLLLLAFFSLTAYASGRYLAIKIVAIIGLLLSFRHLYVVLWPTEVSACVPLALMMDMPIGSSLRHLLHWISQLGRDCASEVDIVTYILIAVLIFYYSWVLYGYRVMRIIDKIRPMIEAMIRRRKRAERIRDVKSD